MTATRWNRRTVLQALTTGAASAALPFGRQALAADGYPSRPIHVVVPVPAGAGPDVAVRQMAPHVGTLLRQPIVIDNRPGAATRIATEHVARSTPDGYTLLVSTPSLAFMSELPPKLNFDPFAALTPVSLLAINQFTLTVNAQVPARTLAEFTALCKKNRDMARFGTLGVGTLPHLTAAWYAQLTGVPAEYVHYSTSGPYTDLLSGQIPAIFESLLPSTLEYVKAGKLRFLAISGDERHPLAPDVPTFAEAGLPEFKPMAWSGVTAPTGTPAPIVQQVSQAFSQVCAMPEVSKSLREVGGTPQGSSPGQFGRFLADQRTTWERVVRQTGIAKA